MTRYTKLDKRRPEYVKNSGHADEGGNSSQESSPEPQASTSTSDKVEASPADSNTKESPSKNGNPETVSQTKKPKAELSEPSKLLKRAKLLRLKSKKAKDISKKNELNRQVRELEQRVNVLNGERGARKAAAKGGNYIGNGAASSNTSALPGVNPWKAMEAERRKVSDARSEIRREKREQERMASQRCFACRQMGHSAKTCPNMSQEEVQERGKKQDNKLVGGAPVVCCYRCGSTEHSLAKCKKPAPRVGPDLPFASCFICGKIGHLASKCEQNQGRGIYPNGGCCMLCQSVDHLAKDCHLRTNASGVNTISNAAISLGGGDSNTRAGADEDDFHSLSRKRREIEEQEKASQIKKRKVAKKVVSF